MINLSLITSTDDVFIHFRKQILVIKSVYCEHANTKLTVNFYVSNWFGRLIRNEWFESIVPNQKSKTTLGSDLMLDQNLN